MTGFRPWSSRLAHTAPVGVAGSHCIPLSISGCTYALPEPQKLFVFNLFSIAYFRSIVKPDEKRSDPITAVDGAPKIRYNLIVYFDPPPAGRSAAL